MRQPDDPTTSFDVKRHWIRHQRILLSVDNVEKGMGCDKRKEVVG